MAKKEIVFVALDWDSHGGMYILDWIFDHFEIGEITLILTCFYTRDDDRTKFMDDVQRKYLPRCQTEKFEAEMLIPQAQQETEIILELINKHGMAKLITSTTWTSAVLKGFGRNHQCKVWVVDGAKLVYIRDARYMDKLLQDEHGTSKKDAHPHIAEKVFIALDDNISRGERILDWVFVNFEKDRVKLIITCIYTGGSCNGNTFINAAQNNYLSRCTEKKEYFERLPEFTVTEYLSICDHISDRHRKYTNIDGMPQKLLKIRFLPTVTFEADIVVPQNELPKDITLELATKHGMETLIISTTFMRFVFEILGENPNLPLIIWVFDEHTGELLHVRDRREVECLKRENDLHQQKKELPGLTKEYEQLVLEKPQLKERLEENSRKLEAVNKRIHDLQAVNGQPLSRYNTLHQEQNKFREECSNVTEEHDKLQEKQLEVLAIEEEKSEKPDDELDNFKREAFDDSKLHEKTKNELLEVSMQLEGMTIALATEEEKSKRLKDELDKITNEAHDESKEHEKTKSELSGISIQLEGMTDDLATEKAKSRTFEDELNKIKSELNKIKREASDESKQHENTKKELLDVSMQLIEVKSLLEIEKKKSTKLDDELIELEKQNKHLEKQSNRHEQSENSLLRAFAGVLEVKKSLEDEVTSLKEKLSNKGNEPQKNDNLHCTVSYGPGMAIFSYAELKVATNDFNDELKIGEGGFGNVYRAVIHCTPVAIKILNKEGGQGAKEFNQEVKTLQNVRHPNLITLIGACPEKGALVYELVPKGSLQDWLGNIEGRKSLSWKRRIQIASETCSALIFLHHFKPHGIAHGDLKPANILLDSNFTCKLSDLGICRQLELTDATTTPLHETERPMGTRGYMDPDYGISYEITTHNDVYAFGVILLQLVTGKDAINIKKLVEDALENKTVNEVLDASAEWPSQVANKMMQLGMRCIHMVKKKRPDLANEVWAEIESMKQVSSSS